jgi:hypothetical protein
MRLEPRKGLADICRRLAALPEDDKEAQRLGNSFRLDHS